MKYRIETKLPDGLAQIPPFEMEEMDADVGDIVESELFNDEGDPLPVGTVVTVTRIA